MTNTTTNTELFNYCDGIFKELNAIYEGRATNDDGEPETFWDYFSDPLDYEFTVNSQGEYVGARVWVTLGGPNVWIDTRRGEIGGAWGADRAERWLPGEIRDEIDEIFHEYFRCVMP